MCRLGNTSKTYMYILVLSMGFQQKILLLEVMPLLSSSLPFSLSPGRMVKYLVTSEMQHSTLSIKIKGIDLTAQISGESRYYQLQERFWLEHYWTGLSQLLPRTTYQKVNVGSELTEAQLIWSLSYANCKKSVESRTWVFMPHSLTSQRPLIPSARWSLVYSSKTWLSSKISNCFEAVAW